MSLSRSLSKIGSLLSSAGLLTPAALANSGAELAAYNPIINGDMRINQRVTSSFSHSGTVAQFPVDRIRVDTYSSAWGNASGGSSAQVALATPLITPGATFDNAVRITPHSSWAHTYVYQNVEDCRIFNGQTVTVSFYARASSNWNISCAGRITQACDNGGTGDVENLDNTLTGKTIGTAWSRFSYSVTLGNMGGKTLGANHLLGVNMLQGVDFSTGAPTWLEFTGFKFELGSVATPFVQRQLETELACCRRFYWQVPAYVGYNVPLCTAFMRSASVGIGAMMFPTPMRRIPSFIVSSSTGHFHLSVAGSDFDTATLGIEGNTYINKHGVSLSCSVSGTSTMGYAGEIYVNNSNAVLAFQAEL